MFSHIAHIYLTAYTCVLIFLMTYINLFQVVLQMWNITLQSDGLLFEWKNLTASFYLYFEMVSRVDHLLVFVESGLGFLLDKHFRLALRLLTIKLN